MNRATIAVVLFFGAMPLTADTIKGCVGPSGSLRIALPGLQGVQGPGRSRWRNPAGTAACRQPKPIDVAGGILIQYEVIRLAGSPDLFERIEIDYSSIKFDNKFCYDRATKVSSCN